MDVTSIHTVFQHHTGKNIKEEIGIAVNYQRKKVYTVKSMDSCLNFKKSYFFNSIQTIKKLKIEEKIENNCHKLAISFLNECGHSQIPRNCCRFQPFNLNQIKSFKKQNFSFFKLQINRLGKNTDYLRILQLQ